MPKEMKLWLEAVVQSVEDQLHQTCWTPAADVYKMSNGWLVKLDIAGVWPEDVQVEVAGRQLTFSGCRRDHLATQGLTYHRLEINYSCFRRTVELPEPLDDARLEMEMDQGMLVVRIEKA